MSVIDEYLHNLSGQEKAVVQHMYALVRQMVPSATEELSYAMPAFKYKGKGLVAIMANKNFLSLYPFGSVQRLGLDLSAYQCTSGSIHFSVNKPIPDELLRQVITARQQQIDTKK
jgi:uncharacterized protein YdhG (YjbR/CyaY superfamily)